MLLRKGVINRTDDSKKLQTVQAEGLADELADNVERFQPFGLSTVLMDCPEDGKGAECVIADLGSASMRAVIIADDRRYRPVNANPGDVLLYGVHDLPDAASHDDALQRIALTDDGTNDYRVLLKNKNCSIEINSADEIKIKNANLTINIAANGALTISTSSTATLTASSLTVNGNVSVNGNLDISGAVTNAGTNISKTHVHTGVQTGTGVTGVVL